MKFAAILSLVLSAALLQGASATFHDPHEQAGGRKCHYGPSDPDWLFTDNVVTSYTCPADGSVLCSNVSAGCTVGGNPVTLGLSITNDSTTAAITSITYGYAFTRVFVKAAGFSNAIAYTHSGADFLSGSRFRPPRKNGTCNTATQTCYYAIDTVMACVKPMTRCTVTTPPPSTTKPPTTGGDPHFVSWSGQKFDFHGECDLVFMHSPNFMNGLGLDIHIRTKIRRNWSYIDLAAIRIGDNVLEVKGGTDEKYWINGVEFDGDSVNSLGDVPIEYKRMNVKQRLFTIKVDETEFIEVRTYKDFVGVKVKGPKAEDFSGSTGISGEYGTGNLLARDGTTVMTDMIVYGQEWQVREEDPRLFTTLEGPQWPLQQCKMPSSFEATTRRRRLGESTFKLNQAEQACREHMSDPTDFDACVYDVLLTDDLEFASAY